MKKDFVIIMCVAVFSSFVGASLGKINISEASTNKADKQKAQQNTSQKTKWSYVSYPVRGNLNSLGLCATDDLDTKTLEMMSESNYEIVGITPMIGYSPSRKDTHCGYTIIFFSKQPKGYPAILGGWDR